MGGLMDSSKVYNLELGIIYMRKATEIKIKLLEGLCSFETSGNVSGLSAGASD